MYSTCFREFELACAGLFFQCGYLLLAHSFGCCLNFLHTKFEMTFACVLSLGFLAITEGPNSVFPPVSGSLNSLLLVCFSNASIYCLHIALGVVQNFI